MGQTKDTRFSVAFGELSVSLLSETAPKYQALWEETTRRFGVAFTEELEEYIRSLNCVYTVQLRSGTLSRVLTDQLVVVNDSGDIGALVDVQLQTSSAEFQRLSEAEQARRVDEAYRAAQANAASKAPVVDKISVLSQCLTNVHIGDMVSVAKFGESMAIMPDRGKPSLVNYLAKQPADASPPAALPAVPPAGAASALPMPMAPDQQAPGAEAEAPPPPPPPPPDLVDELRATQQ